MKSVDEMLRDLKGIGVLAAHVADEMDITPAAMSRYRNGTLELSAEKVAQFHAIYERHMLETPKQKPPTGRDQTAEIVRMAMAGESYADIGRAFDVSRQYAEQVAKQHGVPPRQRRST